MYTFNSRVRYSETDEFGRLSMTGIMNYLQDCSTFQSEDLGLGIEYLKHKDRAWWLNAWQIVVDRYPVLGEEIVVGTWPYGFKGIYGFRNFTIQDRQGNYLVRANSCWFFYDTRNNCPAKVTEDEIRGYGEGGEKLEMDYAPRKVAVPAELIQKKPVPVERHHLDTNLHVNNVKYVELAMECLPERFHIRELRVEYKHAAVLGDVIYPAAAKIPEGYVVTLRNKEGMVNANLWFGGSEREDEIHD